MLSFEQRLALAALIQPQLGANPNSTLVASFVGDAVAADMPTTSLVRQIAEWIIDQALQRPTPDIFIRIVTRVDDGTPRVQSLIALVNNLRADPGCWQPITVQDVVDWSVDADPVVVEDGRPFLDRKSFRALLPRQGVGATPVCTLIEGGAGSGKTYLHKYCTHFAARWEELKIGFTKAGSSSIRRVWVPRIWHWNWPLVWKPITPGYPGATRIRFVMPTTL